MISFSRTFLPWTVIGLMSLSMIALWSNFLSPRKPIQAQVAEADQPPNPMSIIADKLQMPWDIAFLPNDDVLVAELPGRLLHIGASLHSYTVPDIFFVGEAGLLGIAIHPDFEENHWIYLFCTGRREDTLINSVVRYRLQHNILQKDRVILDHIPGGAFHNGGKIAFAPDGSLFVATGDAGNASLPQNPRSLAGKILRMDDEGQQMEVYSYGYRNPLGLAWDDDGHLWASEARPGGKDKIHLVLQGSNYGWPAGGKSNRAAAIDAPGDDPWGIGQIAYGEGCLYAAGLLANSLYEINLAAQPLQPDAHLTDRFGRLRAIAFGPDGFLYIATSNRDGRGAPNVRDDKIVKIDPKNL